VGADSARRRSDGRGHRVHVAGDRRQGLRGVPPPLPDLEGFGVDSERVQIFARGEVTGAPEGVAPDSLRVAVVGSCSPGEQAAAEPEPIPEPVPAPAVETPYPAPPPIEEPSLAATGEEAEERAFASRIGVGLSAGGGVFGLTDSDSQNLTDTGGSWEVRAVFVTQLPAALELAYVGTAQNFEVLDQNLSSELIGNGLEAALRLQYPGGVWRPYGFLGLGWMYYQIGDEVTNLGLDDTDNIGTVPMGVGLAIAPTRGLLIDIRGTYRPAYEDDLLDGSFVGAASSGSLTSWGVTANVGAEF